MTRKCGSPPDTRHARGATLVGTPVRRRRANARRGFGERDEVYLAHRETQEHGPAALEAASGEWTGTTQNGPRFSGRRPPARPKPSSAESLGLVALDSKRGGNVANHVEAADRIDGLSLLHLRCPVGDDQQRCAAPFAFLPHRLDADVRLAERICDLRQL